MKRLLSFLSAVILSISAWSATVTGPVSSTDRAIPTWNGSTGSALFDNPTMGISQYGDLYWTTSFGMLYLHSMSTATRDSRPPADGMIFFNSTLGLPQYYGNGSWHTWIDDGNVPANMFYAGPFSGISGPAVFRYIVPIDVGGADIMYVPQTGSGFVRSINHSQQPAASPVYENDMSFADNATNNVSTNLHGFAPKGDNDSTKFWNGKWQLATPSGANAATTNAINEFSLLQIFSATTARPGNLGTIAGAGVAFLSPNTNIFRATGSGATATIDLTNSFTGSFWQKVFWTNTFAGDQVINFTINGVSASLKTPYGISSSMTNADDADVQIIFEGDGVNWRYAVPIFDKYNPAGSGGGTVTATGGSLTANALVLGAGTTDTKVVAGILSDAISKLILGVAGTSVGSVDFKNGTSGTINLAPTTGALGSVSLVMPATSGTLALTSQLGGSGTNSVSVNATTPVQLNLANGDVIWNLLNTNATATMASGVNYTNANFKGTPTLAGASSGTVSFAAQAAASGTLTYPNGTDTLVGKATTDTFTNKSLDGEGTGNVIAQMKDFVLGYPSMADGAGAVIATNNNTSSGWGRVTYSGTAATNVNNARWNNLTVPFDFSSGTDLQLYRLAVKVGGTSTSSSTWQIGMNTAGSSAPADSTTFSNFVAVALVPSSVTSGDIFYISDVVLTNWAANMTAGANWNIIIQRDGSDANNDTMEIVSHPVLLYKASR